MFWTRFSDPGRGRIQGDNHEIQASHLPQTSHDNEKKPSSDHGQHRTMALLEEDIQI
jgi:hypothetical protein